jgi:hypothetical protein
MRDHRNGEQWDYRTLADLRWHRIRVVCLVCRHFDYLGKFCILLLAFVVGALPPVKKED